MLNNPIIDPENITYEQYEALDKEAESLANKLDFSGLEPLVQNPKQTLLVLDFDGSNTVFTSRRNDTKFYPGLRERLKELLEKGYEVAISSGRGWRELIALVGIPQGRLYAGIHGNQVVIDNKVADHIPKERKIALERAYDEIISNLKLPIPVEPERKPGNLVIHWRPYCYEKGIKGKELEELERMLYKDYINPTVKSYNDSHRDAYLKIRVANHGMNADFRAAIARNKGHALQDFAFSRSKGNKPDFSNILVMGDSSTDGDMFHRAYEFVTKYGTHIVSVTVQQRSTPEWMLRRSKPHLVLEYCKRMDPENQVGGVPLVGYLYDKLLAKQ